MRRLLIIPLILLSSCATEKRCNRLFPLRIDSTYIYIETVKFRDTTIFVELPEKVVEKYIDIKDTLRLFGGYSTAESWVAGDKLHGTLKEGEKPVKIEYEIKEVEVEKIVEVEKVRTVKEKYVPFTYRLTAWAFGFAVLITLIVLLAIYIKKRLYL